jgi:glutamate N-acetyltransferase/amino-acid N-acetyltransferase
VRYSRRVVKSGSARAILVNAGNANACNGDQGDADNRQMAEWVGRRLNIAPDQVLTASTGIIGHLMPMGKLDHGIELAVSALERDESIDKQTSEAIMTTDTRPKRFAVEADSEHWNAPIRFGGMCKGAGMIAPNMATMLAFLTTDARIPAQLLQEALSSAISTSFNCVTIDGDTSTNDMCLLMASGIGGAEISNRGDGFEDFVDGLTRVCIALAKEVARDGEGATKLAEIVVRGAGTSAGAHKIARTIAESPLVKTALFGNDPNWGRLMMAAGRAGVAFDPNKVDVHIGPHLVCSGGSSVEFDRVAAHTYLHNPEVQIEIDLNVGDESAAIWTCDYSYDYIRINAEYHT